MSTSDSSDNDKKKKFKSSVVVKRHRRNSFSDDEVLNKRNKKDCSKKEDKLREKLKRKHNDRKHKDKLRKEEKIFAETVDLLERNKYTHLKHDKPKKHGYLSEDESENRKEKKTSKHKQKRKGDEYHIESERKSSKKYEDAEKVYKKDDKPQNYTEKRHKINRDSENDIDYEVDRYKEKNDHSHSRDKNNRDHRDRDSRTENYNFTEDKSKHNKKRDNNDRETSNQDQNRRHQNYDNDRSRGNNNRSQWDRETIEENQEIAQFEQHGNFNNDNKKSKETVKKEEPNFKLSGKLTEYTNTYNGVVIMYNEPTEARKPKTRWRFYPFKGDESLPMLQLHRQSAFLLGRDRKIADIPVDHPSCSKQHAVIQFRLVDYKRPDGAVGRKVKPYVLDLESTNGTYVNNNRIDPRRYVELIEKDVIKFGFSSREYVILHEKSKDDDPDSEDGGENDDANDENALKMKTAEK